jgi:hypothetical protein
MRAMHRPRPALLSVLLVTVLVAGACAGGATASPAAPTSGSATSGPSAGKGIATPEEAAALVLAADPRFAGLVPKDPEMIGQCCFYEAIAVEGGYQVKVEMGWGDCPAGCTEKHVWTFSVTPAGEVGLIGETGDPIPAGGIPTGM